MEKKGKQEILVSKQWFSIMLFHNVNYLDPQNPLPGSASDLEEQG